MKRLIKQILMLTVILGLVLGISQPAFAVQEDSAVSETIVVYGDALTADQKEQTRRLLEVSDPDDVKEYTVTGEDIANYINGDPNSNMYSSAKITRQKEGEGLTINIVTPDNITEVTSEMYANALLTAGVEDATVDVASPVKVTGSSALSGIYKAYDEEGVELDKERMELANEELDVATELSDKEGMDENKVSELLTEIKKEIAEQDPATKEDVERIVEEQLDKLEVSLSEEDRQLLINLFEKMKDLNIDFDKVKDQLNDIASKVQEKFGDILEDESFWEKVEDFFQRLISFFKNLFS